MTFEPWTKAFPYFDLEDEKRGIALLKEGAVRTVVLAGGVGSRLGFPHPKGIFPITAIHKKSLFQRICEKTIACSHFVGQKLSLAIMTSQENDLETRAYFKEHGQFGLKTIDFFCQESLPYLDDNHQPLINEGPGGNGALFSALKRSNLLSRWQAEGVKIVHVILVDNALADPFDRWLIGHLDRQKADVSLKVCLRKEPHLKVGVLVSENGNPKVVEYSELPENEKTAHTKDGTLLHPFFNLSLMAFSLNFCQKVADIPLPIHLAYKELPGVGMAYKQEHFLFDALAYSNKTTLLEVAEEITFAPLKAKSGEGSPEEVQKRVDAYERALYLSKTKKRPSCGPFEIDAQFYYD